MDKDHSEGAPAQRVATIQSSSFDALAVVSWFLKSKDIDEAVRGVLRWAALDMGRFLTSEQRAEIIRVAREQETCH